MRVPDFLVRQFYVAGSLQREGDGFRLKARNGMGNGTLVGIGKIRVDGTEVEAANITATRKATTGFIRLRPSPPENQSPSRRVTSSRSTLQATH